MKKLRLNPDMVSVESFRTVSPAANAPGTVVGQEAGAVRLNPSFSFTECYTNCSCPPWW